MSTNNSSKSIKDRLREMPLSKIFLLIMLTAIAVTALVWIIVNFRQDKIDVTYYQVKSQKLTNNARIVQLGDLHLREFGDGNSELIERVASLEPDIIAITGDMTIDRVKDYTVVTSLVSKLKDIAPVYYSFGNHEFEVYLFEEGSTIAGDIRAAGATLLSNKYEEIDVNSNTIYIGGICAQNYTFNEPTITNFFNEYDKIDGFKLLLSHSPEIFMGNMASHPVDLALAGDAHGGQIRLPFIGGLYAPGQGFLPKYSGGIYQADGSTLVVTRGLGSSSLIPRFNNNPEIVVVDIGRY